jgi:hypothetical protein
MQCRQQNNAGMDTDSPHQERRKVQHSRQQIKQVQQASDSCIVATTGSNRPGKMKFKALQDKKLYYPFWKNLLPDNFPAHIR